MLVRPGERAPRRRRSGGAACRARRSAGARRVERESAGETQALCQRADAFSLCSHTVVVPWPRTDISDHVCARDPESGWTRGFLSRGAARRTAGAGRSSAADSRTTNVSEVCGYEVSNIKSQPVHDKRRLSSFYVVRGGRGPRIVITQHYALALMSHHGHSSSHLSEHKTWESALSYATACASEVRKEQRRRAAEPVVATAADHHSAPSQGRRSEEAPRYPGSGAPERSITPLGSSLLERATAARRSRESGGSAAAAVQPGVEQDEPGDDDDDEALIEAGAAAAGRADNFGMAVPEGDPTTAALADNFGTVSSRWTRSWVLGLDWLKPSRPGWL